MCSGLATFVPIVTNIVTTHPFPYKKTNAVRQNERSSARMPDRASDFFERSSRAPDCSSDFLERDSILKRSQVVYLARAIKTCVQRAKILKKTFPPLRDGQK